MCSASTAPSGASARGSNGKPTARARGRLLARLRFAPRRGAGQDGAYAVAAPVRGARVGAPPSASRAYPTIRQIVVLVVLLIGSQFAVGVVGVIAIAGVSHIVGRPIEAQSLLLAVVNPAAFGLTFLVAARQAGVSHSEAAPLRPFHPLLLAPILATVAGAHVTVSQFSNLLHRIIPTPDWFLASFGGPNDLGGAWSYYLAVGVVAPITEEFLFRGFFLRGLLRHYAAARAIVVTSLLFAALHLNPWQAPGAIALGIVAGWWTVRTASVLPALLGHVLTNIAPLITIPLLRWDTIPGYVDGATTLWQPLWFNALGLALFVAGIAATHLFLARIPHRHLTPLPLPTVPA